MSCATNTIYLERRHHSFQCLREDPKIQHTDRLGRVILKNSEFYFENLIKTPRQRWNNRA
jgi:hypothetical protein